MVSRHFDQFHPLGQTFHPEFIRYTRKDGTQIATIRIADLNYQLNGISRQAMALEQELGKDAPNTTVTPAWEFCPISNLWLPTLVVEQTDTEYGMLQEQLSSICRPQRSDVIPVDIKVIRDRPDNIRALTITATGRYAHALLIKYAPLTGVHHDDFKVELERTPEDSTPGNIEKLVVTFEFKVDMQYLTHARMHAADWPSRDLTLDVMTVDDGGSTIRSSADFDWARNAW
jgi:hypothetical protein